MPKLRSSLKVQRPILAGGTVIESVNLLWVTLNAGEEYTIVDKPAADGGLYIVADGTLYLVPTKQSLDDATAT